MGTLCAIGWRCFDMILYSRWKILSASIILPLFRLFRCIIYVCVFIFLAKSFKLSIQGYAEWIILAISSSVISLIILVLDTILFERTQAKTILDILKR